MSESGSASNIRAFPGMATPSPKSPIPLDKQKKYDRQLRLWGDHGQSALERARYEWETVSRLVLLIERIGDSSHKGTAQ